MARVVITFVGLVKSSRNLPKRSSAKIYQPWHFFWPRHLFWKSAEISAYGRFGTFFCLGEFIGIYIYGHRAVQGWVQHCEVPPLAHGEVCQKEQR